MDAATASVVVGLGVAIVTAVISPIIVSEVKKREERDPTRGWQAAFTFMQKRIDELDGEVKTLRAEVDRLEGDLSSKNATIARQERIIHDQSDSIMARDRRISQLESSWPTGIALPRPDPAFAHLLQ
jgi:peptidoglycan hydrolase CwlO-like protein